MCVTRKEYNPRFKSIEPVAVSNMFPLISQSFRLVCVLSHYISRKLCCSRKRKFVWSERILLFPNEMNIFFLNDLPVYLHSFDVIYSLTRMFCFAIVSVDDLFLAHTHVTDKLIDLFVSPSLLPVCTLFLLWFLSSAVS